jgi:hypothetical protein
MSPARSAILQEPAGRDAVGWISLIVQAFILSSLRSHEVPYGKRRPNIPELRKITFSKDCGNILQSAAVWITQGGGVTTSGKDSGQ